MVKYNKFEGLKKILKDLVESTTIWIIRKKNF